MTSPLVDGITPSPYPTVTVASRNVAPTTPRAGRQAGPKPPVDSGIREHVTTAPSSWHWPEYGIEALALGTFMLSAAAFAVALEHPASPVRQTVPSDWLRRVFMGLAMGSTAIGIIYSPLGARSGAHMNPATTMTFARLGKIGARDASAYVLAQIAGGFLGIALAAAILRRWIADPHVNFVATQPGMWGRLAAFGAEAVISFLMMTTVLHVSNSRHARRTGLAAGGLVALFIVVEAPISGMSMNPARSLGPAMLSGQFPGFWLYVAAPLAGMLLAAEVFVRRRGLHAVLCARLHHAGPAACIFNCQFDRIAGPERPGLRTHTPLPHTKAVA